jgi:tryptophanase
MLNSKAVIEAVLKASNVDEMCGALDVLSSEIRRQVEAGPIELDDAQAMAEQIAQIRSLLQELERFGVKACQGAGGIPERYLELEGKIKEIRNDLARMVK